MSHTCVHTTLSSWDSNVKVGIQDSLFIKGGIQYSRFKFGLQGPYISIPTNEK